LPRLLLQVVLGVGALLHSKSRNEAYSSKDDRIS